MAVIRMGIVGLGVIAENIHIPGIINSPDAELVAVCDSDKEILERKGQLYGIPEDRRFLNYLDLLSCPDVDAISICTPNDSHFSIAMEALRHRKPILLEKPITLNYEEASQLENILRENMLPNMVCFSYRFKAAARYARYIIRSGWLGEIFHVYGQYLQSWAMNEELPLVWRFKKELCGSGALGDLGSHMIDLIRFLLGDFDKVIAHTGTFIPKRKDVVTGKTAEVDVDDYCHFMAQIGGKIAGTFEISRYAYGRGNYQRVEVYGTKGALVYNLEDEDTLEVCIGDVDKETKAFHKVKIPEQFKVNQMQAFFDMVNAKSDGLAATISDGAYAQKIIDGILKSAGTGRWINFMQEEKKS